jgi:hypothetical protein
MAICIKAVKDDIATKARHTSAMIATGVGKAKVTAAAERAMPPGSSGMIIRKGHGTLGKRCNRGLMHI